MKVHCLGSKCFVLIIAYNFDEKGFLIKHMQAKDLCDLGQVTALSLR